MTQTHERERLTVAILGILLFGAGAMFAATRAPIAGAIGVAIGAGVAGSIVGPAVRVNAAGQQPKLAFRITFLTAFLCSAILLAVLRSASSLGCLSGFLLASAAAQLIVVRRERQGKS